MKKGIFISLCVVFVIAFSTLMYFNYDAIMSYITNKDWEIADSIASISFDRAIDVCAVHNCFAIMDGTSMIGYSNSTNKEFEENMVLTNPVHSGNGKYFVVGDRNGTTLHFFAEKQKQWDYEVSGKIVNVFVNKNGYVAVIYTETRYKSLIKVLKSNGEELFTSYLASSYAVDVAISNDNNTLAIAEVDTSGIKIKSAIKFIDTTVLNQEEIKVVDLEENSLLLDIGFTDKNELLVLTDGEVDLVKRDGTKTNLAVIDSAKCILTSIDNDKVAILVEKLASGIFSNEAVLKIYSTTAGSEPIVYSLDTLPKAIYSMNKTIAVDLGSEILFLNTSGKLVKRCELKGEVKKIQLYQNGNMAGLVFRDRVELVKL